MTSFSILPQPPSPEIQITAKSLAGALAPGCVISAYRGGCGAAITAGVAALAKASAKINEAHCFTMAASLARQTAFVESGLNK